MKPHFVIIDELNQYDKDKETISPLELSLGAEGYKVLMEELDKINNLKVEKK